MSSAVKNICEWIKSMVSNLIPRWFRRQAPEPAHVMTPLEKKLAREIQKRQAIEGKPVNTRQGGPNMPKYQPCTCGRWGRRKRKTMGGAYYKCSKHSEFFVRAPAL